MLTRKKQVIVILVVALFVVLTTASGYYLWKVNFNKNVTTSIIDNEIPSDTTKYYPDRNAQIIANRQQAGEIYSLGKKWFLNNIKEDGSFIYLYDLENKREKNSNNIIRQLLAFRVVANFCKHGEQEFCELHKKNLDFIFKNGIYKTETKNGKKIGYVLYKKSAKLGSSALLLRLLVASPYYDQYEKEVQELIEGIKFLQNKDGSFKKMFFVTAPGLKYSEKRKMRFYPGEAMLALLEYYQKTGEQSIFDLVKKMEDFYYKVYVDEMEKNYYPSYVPWQTFVLSKLYFKTRDMKYAKAVFKLNDQLIKIQNKNNGRFYDPEHPEYGKPHTASDAIYAESLTKAYILSLKLNDQQHRQKYAIIIKRAMDGLSRLQLCNSANSLVDVPTDKCGALLVRKESRSLRVDSLAHTMDFVRLLKK